MTNNNPRPMSMLSGAAGAAHSLKQRGEALSATASQIDKIVSEIFANKSLSTPERYIQANQSVSKGMVKFNNELNAAREYEELMIKANTVNLKSSQLRSKPWNDRLSAMLPFIMADLQKPGANLGNKSDDYLQVALSLSDNNLANGRGVELDETYSRDDIGFIKRSDENIKFISTMQRKSEEWQGFDLKSGQLPDMIAGQSIPQFED